MKRLILVLVLTAGVAAALAGWALSAPAAGPSAAVAPAAEQALPPLPAAVRNRKRWIVGVKCDAPPFGYIDVRGHNQGVTRSARRAASHSSARRRPPASRWSRRVAST